MFCILPDNLFPIRIILSNQVKTTVRQLLRLRKWPTEGLAKPNSDQRGCLKNSNKNVRLEFSLMKFIPTETLNK